ncbi:sensor histidine kinase [Luteimonas saliphila]|uniref:sensor histidine kinase n=1 Tax=Luteimonas saliphila TaxID=2804919 RepID=UPI00192DA9B4|nr:sensor histidine kinase [Luteimonas saliphila]
MDELKGWGPEVRRNSSEQLGRRTWSRIARVACLLAGLFVGGALAEPAPGLSGYGHFAWTLQDGAPADIWAIAQSADGYLWLGTGFGLHRFDGVRFERFEPSAGGALPSANVTAVTSLPSGELWVGYYHGGLTRIRDGRATHYRVDQDLRSGLVYRIFQGPGGELWAVIGNSLLRFADDRWHRVGPSAGYPHGSAYWIEADHRGAIWVASGDSIVVRARGGTRFEDTGIRVDPQAILAVSPDGTMWVSDARGGTRPIYRDVNGRYRDGSKDFPELKDVEAARLLFLGDGTLWGSRRGRGLFRTVLPGGGNRMGGVARRTSLQTFGEAEGLTSDVAVPVFEDREGNVWSGTILGLNRFRYRNVVPLPVGLAEARGYDQVMRAEDGSAVAVSSSGVMVRLDRASMQRLLDGGSVEEEVRRTKIDAWWLGEWHGLWRVEQGVRRRHPYPGEGNNTNVDAMLVDHKRRIWLSVRNKGVYIWEKGQWGRRADVSQPSPVVMAAGHDGRVWLGFRDGRVAVVDEDRIHTYPSGPDLKVGPVTALHAGKRETVVAGELGVARFDGVRFRSRIGDTALSGVTGILEGDDRVLWMNGSRGVVRMHADDLAVAVTHLDQDPRYVLFDQIDGLPGVALQAKAIPSAVNADGLLWFGTNSGLAMVDPERIRTNQQLPNVLIRSVSSSRIVFEGDDGGAFPSGERNIQIAYTATSLSAPERVQFRYRIDGIDEDWRHAGSRREAFYTNLGPGEYTFRVIASNNDGLWNDQGATVTFRIRPTFFESGWFLLACVAMIAIGFCIAYVLHMRQLAIRMKTRLEERHFERERIARELHDTLLQSMQGLILGLHALAHGDQSLSSIRQRIKEMTDRMESVLVQGRDRVQGLRAVSRDSSEISKALAAAGSESCISSANLEVSYAGRPRKLLPLVRDELFHVGREALLNADRHSEARTIRVTVEYGRKDLRLLVADDGVGIDDEILARGYRVGHWGMSGMRERVDRIGGTLEVRSERGNGTLLRVVVPARRAYAARTSAGRALLRGWNAWRPRQ